MPKYIVSAMIQAPFNEPVSVHWYKGDNLARAVASMADAAVHDEDVDAADSIPASVRYRTLGVTLDIEQTPVEESVRGCSCGMADYGAPGHDGHESATPSTEDPFFDDFDTETEDHSLSDCFFWGWKNATDCAGPRVGTAVRRGDEKIVVVCEHHFNNPPE